MVVSELRGEKIDIIPYNDEPARFVAKALSPARVREVLVDDEGKQATVIVPDDQLSLAIGREGQNARLAARLTGWRIDIRSETEFATEEQEGGYEEETESGRCAAILTSGRRCPNAALPGSRYCGLPTHQALEGTGSDHVGGEPVEEEITLDAEAEAAEVEVAARRRGRRRRRGAGGREAVAEEPEPAAEGSDLIASDPQRRCVGCGQTASEGRPGPRRARRRRGGRRPRRAPSRARRIRPRAGLCGPCREPPQRSAGRSGAPWRSHPTS